VLIGTSFGYRNDRPKFIHRYDVDGLEDRTWVTHVGNAYPYDHGVYALLWQSDGNLLIGGNFAGVDDYPYYNYARLLPSGAVDSSFINPAYGNFVLNLISAKDGAFYALNGAGIQRYSHDGSMDNTFLTWIVRGDELLTAVEDELGGLIVAGELGRTFSNRFVTRLLSNGQADPDFGISPDGAVLTLRSDGEGNVILGGNFRTINGSSNRFLARISLTPGISLPGPTVQTRRLGPNRIVVSWPAAFADYQLQATHLMNRRKPEKTKWKAVETLPVINGEWCSVTNRVARYGRWYRLGGTSQ
jgi:hypothetical protein